MVETRTRILGIAPYEGMHAAMDRAAQAYPNVQMDVFTGDLDVAFPSFSGCRPIPMTVLSPAAGRPT